MDAAVHREVAIEPFAATGHDDDKSLMPMTLLTARCARIEPGRSGTGLARADT